jgi:hypothetical protein
MADHASVAAAITAGYKQITLDRGAGALSATRWEVTLEKQVLGESGADNSRIRAMGQGSSQAAAEAVALAALNKQRAHRYGRTGTTEDVS